MAKAMSRTSPTLPEIKPSPSRFEILRRGMPDEEAAIDDYLRTGQDSEHFADFVEACEDYEACQRALSEPLLHDYVTEFRALACEIEAQIRGYLERRGPS